MKTKEKTMAVFFITFALFVALDIARIKGEARG